MKFARIRPYDKQRGQLVRRYVYGGFRFEADHGWYEVDDEIAEYLKGVLTFPENPDSKPVFDVSDQAGAEKIALEEYEEAHPERKISEAIAGAQTVTLADLDKGAKGETVLVAEAAPAGAGPEAGGAPKEEEAGTTKSGGSGRRR